MRKKVPKYALWSDELLRDKWNQISEKREKLINKISRYDVRMQEIKDTLRARKPVTH